MEEGQPTQLVILPFQCHYCRLCTYHRWSLHQLNFFLRFTLNGEKCQAWWSWPHSTIVNYYFFWEKHSSVFLDCKIIRRMTGELAGAVITVMSQQYRKEYHRKEIHFSQKQMRRERRPSVGHTVWLTGELWEVQCKKTEKCRQHGKKPPECLLKLQIESEVKQKTLNSYIIQLLHDDLQVMTFPGEESRLKECYLSNSVF